MGENLLKMRDKTIVTALLMILIINLFLNAFGIRWGLPDRWNVDQKVTETVSMAAEKRFVSRDFYHPPFYDYLLMLFLAPYFLLLKINGYPLEAVKAKASISWIKLAESFPSFATNIFVLSRFLSCLTGVLTVYFVFLITKRIFNSSVALLAAFFISVTMGFVGVNHFELCSSLINLLAVIAVYFCIKAIDTQNNRNYNKDLMIAGFFCGLSFSTKYNGIILVLPLLAAYYLEISNNLSQKFSIGLFKKLFFSKNSILLLFVFALGFLFGWPTFFYSITDTKSTILWYKDFLLRPSFNISPWINLANYTIQLIIIYGIPLFLFIFAGVIYYLISTFNPKRRNNKILILFSFIIPYFLINIFSIHHKYAYTKFVILIVPVLVIFGAKAMFELVKLITHPLKWLIPTIVFLYSFLYSFSGDLQFVKYDSRYQSTEWILKNIPLGSSIEHIDQMDWLFSSKIIRNYNIIYLGRNSHDYTEKSLYKISDNRILEDANYKIENYCKVLNENEPKSQYFIIFLPEPGDLYDLPQKTECEKLFFNLLNGKFHYKVIKEFKPSNWKVNSKFIKGLSFPKNFFWKPIPESYVSPYILIFEKTEA
jgi:4-amino-4-deoxy-L-arabinose transferase-like glycosyltransferase